MGRASLVRAVFLLLFLAGACHCNGDEFCDAGSLRCHGTKVQICYPDDWMTIVDCATTGQVCSASEPACADAGES
jgi:hypothetical protein